MRLQESSRVLAATVKRGLDHWVLKFSGGDDKAWEKLQRALRAQIDPEAFEQMRGAVSFPFQAGKHERIAVKVIDFRGNEVVRVMLLDGGAPVRFDPERHHRRSIRLPGMITPSRGHIL
jgi:hypothetical protein